MATKMEKKIGTLLGIAAGALIAYNNSDPNNKDRWLKIIGGGFLGGAVGYGVVCLLGEPSDTVNYSLYNRNGKRIYEGISYESRINQRIIEHKNNGKHFQNVKFDQPKPRSEARLLEMYRIKRHLPKYNVQHVNVG